MRELFERAGEGDWDSIADRLDEDFFRLLLTDRDALVRIYRMAPAEWFERHPRQVMSRGLVLASSQPQLRVQDLSVAAFRQWVQGQQTPATRDVIALLVVDAWSMIAVGRFDEAARVADRILDTVANARDVAGFHDVLPVTLLRAGTAVLLARRPDDALPFFDEAIHWATARTGHPAARYASQYHAMTLALTGRIRSARELLERNPPAPRAAPDTPPYRYQGPALLTECLLALEALDQAQARAAMEAVDDGVRDGDFWWVAVHVRARYELLWGSPTIAEQLLTETLDMRRLRSSAQHYPGALLRADLADAHQAAGHLQCAERVLQDPDLLPTFEVDQSSVRLHLLRGRPAVAREMLRVVDSPNGRSQGSARPGALVLTATADHASVGKMNRRSIERAADAVRHHCAFAALIEASPEVRRELGEQLDIAFDRIPGVFAYLERPRLTAREQEILDMLGAGLTISEMAGRMYLSQNTVRTHLRRLYRKLDAHSKEEALWATGHTQVPD